MTGRPRICLTAEDAFQAGWDAPCEHGIPDPAACERCRLTDAEIGRLTVLHRAYVRRDNSGRLEAA